MAELDTILTSGDLQVLADIGFIASSRGLNKHAGVIFAAIRALRPQQEAGFVGDAVNQILVGNYHAAVKSLEKAPTTLATRTFLGIALLHEGDTAKGHGVLTAVVRAASDTPYAHLAQNALYDV
ncbi:hypothetical protein PDO_5173 [Rhizobium sp. PDO1-076]|uniref:hypothetical protein n=1 Tax=Rhizobium sp. PDO1-076 TaxID=1125979 RepID=UPI00024E3CB2|nr:hypothetical protein [Rhizobium sp. PDO1-076]EHS51348.1 hypothetical protein PDO_5173 [Rhizobium sp. PDO1-076]